MRPADCRRMAELLHFRLDRDLADEDAEMLDAHLADCADCAAVWAGLSSVDERLRTRLAAPEPTPDLVAAARARADLPSTRRRPVWWAVPAVALIGAAVVVGSSVFRARPDGPPAVVRSEAPLHIFADGETVSHTAFSGDALAESDVIWGADQEWAVLEFANGARIELSEDAIVQVGRDSLSVCQGSLRADLTRVREPFTLVTRWGVLQASGASFSLTAKADDEARLSVTEGAVRIRQDGAFETAEAGRTVDLIPSPRGGPSV